MTTNAIGRLGRIERMVVPRRVPRFLIVHEDESGRWWEFDEPDAGPIDRDAIPPDARVIVLTTRPDGPQ